MSLSKMRLVGLLVAGVVTVAATNARADEAPGRVLRAARVVQQEAKTIVAWAYPTVTFRGFDGCAWNGADELDCRFTYKDMLGDRESRVLRFGLDEDGMISGIADGDGEGFIPPFATLRGVKGMLAAMAKSDLQRKAGADEEGQRALLQLLSNSPEPEEVLSFLLNVAIFLAR